MYLERFFGEGGSPHPCAGCQGDQRLDFDIRMAFQPIVDARDRSIYGYEALVRTMEGGSAAEVIARVRPEQLYRFDQTCRVKAIATAARLGLRQRLSINFFPNAVYEPATCIRLTLAAAQTCGFPTDKLIFEAAESEQVRDQSHVTRIFRDYQSRGFLTAIDDFGAGYAGL
ncbi:MAG TPA: EAL domain-containing protein, partial [Luteimonas sp.]|nr:EAL domain-containing protein [Luteimonas sp.]